MAVPVELENPSLFGEISKVSTAAASTIKTDWSTIWKMAAFTSRIAEAIMEINNPRQFMIADNLNGGDIMYSFFLLSDSPIQNRISIQPGKIPNKIDHLYRISIWPDIADHGAGETWLAGGWIVVAIP